MNLIEAIFGKQCEHEFEITDVIKEDYYTCNEGIFAEVTEVHTCKKCEAYYFLKKGYQKQAGAP